MSETEVQLTEIRGEIQSLLKNKQAFNDLATTTFKGITVNLIPQILLQGHMMGFTVKDFMVKNIYALPFAGSFALSVGIDYSRKKAQRSGQTGKSKPIFTETEDGKLESCEITVYKKDGHPDGYTALVYFDEYNQGNTMWKKKPRTMLAKVAEMHALRMAFPDELSQVYVEEEVSVMDIEPNDSNIQSRMDDAKKDTNLTMGSHVKNQEKQTEQKSEDVDAVAESNEKKGGSKE